MRAAVVSSLRQQWEGAASHRSGQMEAAWPPRLASAHILEGCSELEWWGRTKKQLTRSERERGRGGGGGVFVQLLTSERLTHAYKYTEYVKKVVDLVQTSQ